jgi:hypothetical protein
LIEGAVKFAELDRVDEEVEKAKGVVVAVAVEVCGPMVVGNEKLVVDVDVDAVGKPTKGAATKVDGVVAIGKPKEVVAEVDVEPKEGVVEFFDGVVAIGKPKEVVVAEVDVEPKEVVVAEVDVKGKEGTNIEVDVAVVDIVDLVVFSEIMEGVAVEADVVVVF